jgi:hypothetical protein
MDKTILYFWETDDYHDRIPIEPRKIGYDLLKLALMKLEEEVTNG